MNMKDNTDRRRFYPYLNLPNSLNIVGLKARLLLRDNDFRLNDICNPVKSNNDENDIEEGEKELVIRKKIPPALKAKIQRYQLKEMSKRTINEIILDERNKVSQIAQTREKAERQFYNDHSIPSIKPRHLPHQLAKKRNIFNDQADARQSISCLSTRHYVSDHLLNSSQSNYRDILLGGGSKSSKAKATNELNPKGKKTILASINEAVFKKIPILKRNHSTNRYAALNNEGTLYHSLFNQNNIIMKYGMFNLSSIRTSFDLKNRVNNFVANYNKGQSQIEDGLLSNRSANNSCSGSNVKPQLVNNPHSTRNAVIFSGIKDILNEQHIDD